jgi:hypothetical protein
VARKRLRHVRYPGNLSLFRVPYRRHGLLDALPCRRRRSLPPWRLDPTVPICNPTAPPGSCILLPLDAAPTMIYRQSDQLVVQARRLSISSSRGDEPEHVPPSPEVMDGTSAGQELALALPEPHVVGCAAAQPSPEVDKELAAATACASLDDALSCRSSPASPNGVPVFTLVESDGVDGDGEDGRGRGAWPSSCSSIPMKTAVFLSDLPNEILFHILGFLDVGDLLATSRVSVMQCFCTGVQRSAGHGRATPSRPRCVRCPLAVLPGPCLAVVMEGAMNIMVVVGDKSETEPSGRPDPAVQCWIGRGEISPRRRRGHSLLFYLPSRIFRAFY